MDSTPTARNFERRQLAIEQAATIAETAGNLLSDRSLSHEQRLAALELMEAAFGCMDALGGGK